MFASVATSAYLSDTCRCLFVSVYSGLASTAALLLPLRVLTVTGLPVSAISGNWASGTSHSRKLRELEGIRREPDQANSGPPSRPYGLSGHVRYLGRLIFAPSVARIAFGSTLPTEVMPRLIMAKVRSLSLAFNYRER